MNNRVYSKQLVRRNLSIMDRNYYYLEVICLLLALIQGAVMQDDEPPIEEGCPAVSGTSVRVLCQSPEGPTACVDAKVGSKARIFWLKEVVQAANTKRGAAVIVCEGTGAWKRAPSKWTGGGERDDARETTREAMFMDDVTNNMRTSYTRQGTTTTAAMTTTWKPLPPGYTTLQGFGSYKLYTEPVDAMFANQTCQDDGGKLLYAESASEINALYKEVLASKLAELRFDGLLVDAKATALGTFQTSAGVKFPGHSSLVWGPGQPSTTLGSNCVVITVPKMMATNVPCVGRKANFVCKRPLY